MVKLKDEIKNNYKALCGCLSSHLHKLIHILFSYGDVSGAQVVVVDSASQVERAFFLVCAH